MIVLRPDQEAVRTKLRVALRSSSSVLTYAPTGFGKCLGKDTPVIMADGSVKMVQDVRRGDRLMGPDSKPRRVLSTCAGIEMLYRVTPKTGEPYVVNASHILSLKMTNGSKNSTGLADQSVQNIEVRDYLRRNKTFRHCAKGWRVPVEFPAHSDAPIIDPYFIGLWLGDGTSRKPSITTGDQEIYAYCASFFAREGLKLRVEPNSSLSQNLHAENPKGVGNPLKSKMTALGLIMNKHVPHRYKTGSKTERLQLLAGVIDSDGYLIAGGGYGLTLKNERLIDDVIFLARSLGFSATKRSVSKTCCNNGRVGSYFNCSINGAVDTVPVRVPRKKAPPRRQIKDVLLTGITVEPIGEGEYFGFEIDGDRLFLLGDFTVTHNTVLAAALIKMIFEAGKRVIFCVHRVDLITQTAKTFQNFGIPFSYIAAGYPCNSQHRVWIASIATLRNRLGRFPADYVMVDEAHLSIAAGWAAVALHYKSEGSRLIGYTGSPERLDGKPLGDVWDQMVMGPSVAWLIERGLLSRYRAFSPAGMDLSGVRVRNGEFVSSEIEELTAGKAVLKGAVKHWQRFAGGKRTIAFTPSVARSEQLAEEFRAQGVTAVALDGETPQSVRREAFIDFADRRIDVIVNCALFCEGFDLAAQVDRDVTIEAVLDYAPSHSLARTLQKWGRGLRRKPEPAVLLDLVGGFARHGFPDDEREWSLEGRKKKEREVDVTVCPSCYAAHVPAPKCPHCGFVHEKQAGEGFGRVLGEVDGELEEVDIEALRLKRTREQGMAKSVGDLVSLATARGYKKPEAWAAKIWTARQAATDRRYGDMFR